MNAIWISHVDYDIRQNFNNKHVPATLHINFKDPTKTDIVLHFMRPEDLEEFVSIVNELEIANDTFNADKEDKEA